MHVERLVGGPWGQNCFVVHSDGHAVLIDPGGATDESVERILAYLRDRSLELAAIVNTHGHFDHIGGVTPIVAATGAEFVISAREVPIMKSSNMLRFIFKVKERVVVPSTFTDLDELPDTIERGGITIRCIETPGHTPGGHCFVIDGHIFTGDTVLRTMPATSELPGGDAEALAASIALLRTLPPELILHPGHGRDSTLGEALDSLPAHVQPAGGMP